MESEQQQNSEAYNASSPIWADFIFSPAALESHLDALSKNEAINPNAAYLINGFIHQASLSQIVAKDGRKQAHSLSLESASATRCRIAAAIAAKLDFNLFKIEALLNSKYHQLALQLSLILYDQDRALLHLVNLSRWAFRCPKAQLPNLEFLSWIFEYDAERNVACLEEVLATVLCSLAAAKEKEDEDNDPRHDGGIMTLYRRDGAVDSKALGSEGRSDKGSDRKQNGQSLSDLMSAMKEEGSPRRPPHQSVLEEAASSDFQPIRHKILLFFQKLHESHMALENESTAPFSKLFLAFVYYEVGEYYFLTSQISRSGSFFSLAHKCYQSEAAGDKFHQFSTTETFPEATLMGYLGAIFPEMADEDSNDCAALLSQLRQRKRSKDLEQADDNPGAELTLLKIYLHGKEDSSHDAVFREALEWDPTLPLEFRAKLTAVNLLRRIFKDRDFTVTTEAFLTKLSELPEGIVVEKWIRYLISTLRSFQGTGPFLAFVKDVAASQNLLPAEGESDKADLLVDGTASVGDTEGHISVISCVFGAEKNEDLVKFAESSHQGNNRNTEEGKTAVYLLKKRAGLLAFEKGASWRHSLAACQLYQLVTQLSPDDWDSRGMTWMLQRQLQEKADFSEESAEIRQEILDGLSKQAQNGNDEQGMSEQGSALLEGSAGGELSQETVEWMLTALLEDGDWLSVDAVCAWAEKWALSSESQDKGRVGLTVAVAMALRRFSKFCEYSNSQRSGLLTNEQTGLANGLLKDLLCLLFDQKTALGTQQSYGDRAENPKRRKIDVLEPTAAEETSMAETSAPVCFPSCTDAPIVLRLQSAPFLMFLVDLIWGYLYSSHASGASVFEVSRERLRVQGQSSAGLRPETGFFFIDPLRVFGLLKEWLRIGNWVDFEGLVGLGDVYFHEQNFLEAARTYLKAGAMATGNFLEASDALPARVWSQQLVKRTVACLRSIGFCLPAVVLCQLAPQPDMALAFDVLSEWGCIGDDEFDFYYDCVSNVSILEVLVTKYSEGGDNMRVHLLMEMIQKREANSSCPPYVQEMYVRDLRRKFMVRLYGQLCPP